MLSASACDKWSFVAALKMVNNGPLFIGNQIRHILIKLQIAVDDAIATGGRINATQPLKLITELCNVRLTRPYKIAVIRGCLNK